MPRLHLPARRPGVTLPRVGRRERRRGEIRDRLFRAALALFAEQGYLETTVEDITEAADVGKGTFFNYFPTKEHVLATFGAERIAAIEQTLEKVKASKGPVLPIIGELAADLAGQAREAPALLRAIYAAQAACAPVRAQLQKRMGRARHLLAEMYAVAQERGEVSGEISAADLGRLTQMIFMGVTVCWSLKPEGSLHGVAAEVWGMLSPGLRAGEIRTSHRRRRNVRS